jgi:Anti-sigma-K factor rskA, C-terminal
MTDDRHISQEELAMHAMQTLAGEECAALRQHLAECEECREQLAEITGDLALVAMSVEQHAVPEGARQRFIDRLNLAPGRAETPAPNKVIPISRDKRASRSWIWIPWTAVAALLILSAALGVKIFFLSQQLETIDALLRHNERLIQKQNADNLRARALLDALTAPTAQRVTLTTGKTPPAPSARAVYMASRGALILQASNMQPLPPDKTYELWVIPASGAPIPAGTFRPDASGSGSVVMPWIPQGVQAKAFGITVENAGGAETPTMPIILSGAAS